MAEDLTVRPLSPETWAAFADLVTRHGGIFGGCWCLSFHQEGNDGALNFDARCAAKKLRVEQGTAHAALVFAEGLCVGWCQFGSPAELPRIKNRKAYQAGLGALPDWRITCFFVDKQWRKRGVARVALAGALAEMARLGGGVVEAYPEDVAGKKTMPVALHCGALSLMEAAGFERQRMIGKSKWVVTRRVDPA